MSAALPWMLLLALTTHAAAHVTLVVSLARARERRRAAFALLVPPLAPYWGWRAGMRATVVVWTAALALYALGVAVSA